MFGDGIGEQIARALGGLDRGVAHHQRHAAGVGAEIDRRQIGVAGDRPHVDRVDAQHLRHARHQHVVGSLADLGRAAERGDAAAAIELQLDAGVRHVVPVDRQAGAGEVRRAGEADPAAGRQLAERVRPVGGGGHAADALGEADGADAQVVRRQRVRLLDDAEAEVGGIDGEALGDLVELNFLAEAALRRAVSALGAARRLVGEDAAALELVARDVIGDRLQRAGVERAGDAVRAVGAAVEQRLQVHAGDACRRS